MNHINLSTFHSSLPGVSRAGHSNLLCFSLLSRNRRVGVGHELGEVSLEPGSGLRSRHKSVRKTAVGVVAGGGGVGAAVALAAGLDPDEGVLEWVTGVGAGAGAEAGALDVAPVTPCLLRGGLDTIASYCCERLAEGKRQGGGKEWDEGRVTDQCP